MLSKNANLKLMETFLKNDSDSLSALIEIFNTNAWPPRDILSLGLSRASHNVTNYPTSNRFHSAYKANGFEGTQQMWEDFIAQSKISIVEFPLLFLNNFLYQGYSAPVKQLILNTPVDKLEAWLSEKDVYSMFNDTARDKCTNLGMLVQFGSIPLIKTLVNIVPNCLKNLDHKNRSVLFYARDLEMIKYLSENGVDSAIKDKDGLTASQMWTDVLKTPLASQWIDALSQMDEDTRVVQKLITMELSSLTPEEKTVLAVNAQNPNYKWSGNIFGCEKSWSLSEIWNFVVVLHGADLIASTQKRTGFYYYGTVASRVGRIPNNYKDFVREQESHLPAELQSEIREKSNTSMALLWLVAFGKKWSGSYKDLITVDANYEKDLQMSRNASNFMLDFVPKLDDVLANSSEKDRQEFATSLKNYAGLTNLWSHESISVRFTRSAKMFVLPVEKGGVLTRDLSSSIAFLRINEGMRSPGNFDYWKTAFNEFVVPLWNDDVKKGNDLQVWSPVLQLGLSFSALTKDCSSQPIMRFHDTLQDMLLKNVEIEKIPVRFAKNMPPNLRSAASRWVLNKTLAPKIKEKEIAQEAPRRKM